MNLAELYPDSAPWTRAMTRTGSEPFTHAAYMQLEAAEGARPLLLSGQNPSLVLPLLIRPLPHFASGRLAPSLGGNFEFDATSPYGYGGPYFEPGETIDWPEFWECLLAWLQANKVLTLFMRLSLGHTPSPLGTLVAGRTSVEVRKSSENVVIDLTRPLDDQWRHYDHKVRKNVRKAERGGLTATVKDTFTDVEEFTSLYLATMDRRSAQDRYRYDADFFMHFTAALAPAALVAEVRDADGQLVSGELVLRSGSTLYSYLGGTYAHAFPLAPNDLLKHTVVEYGTRAGFRRYVLGGGYRPDDGIFRYKRAFDRDGVVPFYTARLVADTEALDTLTRDLPSSGAEADGSSDFFPPYRRG
jgi:hypothetical protein